MTSALKTALFAAASWGGALAIWAPGLLAGWLTRNGPGRPTAASLMLGLPLVLAVPLIHAPLLRWLMRRWQWRFPRIVLVSVLLALPLAAWPVGMLTGALDELRAGQVQGVPKLLRGLSTPEARAFFPVYGTFGLLFGIWLSRSEPREKSSRD
jgi:hypothetical protein